jgi:predicted nucleic acid-binding protein
VGWTAFLDACVLHPWATADLLLRLSEKYVYRILWSQDVLDETRRSLIANAGLSEEQADRRIAKMQEAFPEALVTGYGELVPSMGNDPGDRHVLAAAVVGKADVIVTDNPGHFPESVCSAFDLEIQTADQFLMHSLSLYPDVVAGVFLDQAQASRPPTSLEDALDRAQGRLPLFVEALRADRVILSRLALLSPGDSRS